MDFLDKKTQKRFIFTFPLTAHSTFIQYVLRGNDYEFLFSRNPFTIISYKSTLLNCISPLECLQSKTAVAIQDWLREN